MSSLRDLEKELGVKVLGGRCDALPAKDEAVVLCLVRDGEYYVDRFVRYYLDLGYKHIYFMDNGSSDGTVDSALQYPEVTVLQTLVNYREYKFRIKTYLSNRFAEGGWGLVADIDEFFEYPLQREVGLPRLLEYLNRHGYTSMIGQLVDLFKDSAIGDVDSNPFDPERGQWYYDLSCVEKSRYRVATNTVSNPEIPYWRGGVRQSCFGVNPSLTKNPLNFGDGKVIFRSAHKVLHRTLADISAVIRHYKFTGPYQERIERNKELLRHYDQYHKTIVETPAVRFIQPTALAYTSNTTWQGVALVTRQYEEFVRGRV